jgi:CheY-like chemotaxis protein
MPGAVAVSEVDPVKKVMLVDDDDDVRLIAQMALRDVGGWPTLAVASGRLAITLAPTERPDVILLDVMMPDLDGPSALRQMQRDPATADIPVIFMTAKARPSEIERLVAAGAAGVITKPFDPMTLAHQVRAIVLDHRAARATAHDI